MAKIDYMYNDDYTLKIINGDFIKGNADVQHAEIILSSSKGEIRQYPTLGANMNALLGANIDANILYNIAKKELAKDDLILDNIETEVVNNKDYTLKIWLKS